MGSEGGGGESMKRLHRLLLLGRCVAVLVLPSFPLFCLENKELKFCSHLTTSSFVSLTFLSFPSPPPISSLPPNNNMFFFFF